MDLHKCTTKGYEICSLYLKDVVLSSKKSFPTIEIFEKTSWNSLHEWYYNASEWFETSVKCIEDHCDELHIPYPILKNGEIVEWCYSNLSLKGYRQIPWWIFDMLNHQTFYSRLPTFWHGSKVVLYNGTHLYVFDPNYVTVYSWGTVLPYSIEIEDNIHSVYLIYERRYPHV